MINKLRKKVSLIIFFAISIPVLFIISIYTFSYYNDTVRFNTGFVDKFIREPNGGPNDKKNEKIDTSNIEGIYSISINNGTITRKSENVTEEIEEYVLKASIKERQEGIIGNYFYKKRIHEMKNGDINIILIEGSNDIKKIKIVIIISSLVTIIGLVLIYILSRLISSFIVKPVEDTFNKQIDFISDASHELKTPLAVIQANVDVLEEKIKDNKWLNYIQNETDNMDKLINELLLLTKIENIDKLREPERFNMSDHVELVTSSFESMAFEKKIKLESNIQRDIILDKFNKDDITHILSTLIDNAIKHTQEKNKVIVELNKNKDKLIINVKNKGEEIPVSERDKIFDRFYRLDKSRNRNEKRYGLGLSIAKATVIKNNGDISVKYIDGYTIFKVELPL